MKSIKDLFEVYRPKPKDEQKFVDKHVTIKHQDRNGNGDEVFNASKVEADERKKSRHGYDPGEDEKVYEENDIEEAKADSPIKGTRLVSKHMGQDGYHVEVRKNPEWDEYQVHHYKDGAHLGEGPVSYHGDDKADAKETAEHAIKTFKVEGGKLKTIKEEVESFYDTTENVHKECLDKGLSGSLKEDINEAREITPELRAAQKNLVALRSGKVEPKPKAKSLASRIRDDDNYHKAEIKHHKEKYKYHAQNAKDAESMMQDLHSGNLGIPTDNKHWMRGAEDEIDSMINKHLEAMHHHRKQMHYHNSFLSKPLKLKEDIEQIDEISKKTLGSYVKKAAVDLAGHSYKSGHKDGQRGPTSITGPSKKEDNRLSGIVRVTTKLTKEDVINKTLEKILPENYEPRPLEERFVESIEHLNESLTDSLMDLFVNLDEENQKEMVRIVRTNEGINELLNFVIENREILNDEEE